ncbi:hypothetical protein D3C73_1449690 [compost metagenome]
MADTVGVLDQGRLLREVSLDSVRASTTEFVEIVTSNVTQAAFVLVDNLGISSFKQLGDRTLRVYDNSVSQEALSKELVLNDVPIESINRRHHTLEEYFFEMIKGGGEHAASHRTGV